VLLSGDVDGLNAHQPTVLFQRSYGWVASLDPDTLRVAGLPGLLRAAAAAASDAERSGMVLTAPDDALVTAASRARASSRRLLLVGGQLVAVLAAFVALAALGLRDDHATARNLLARRGASQPCSRTEHSPNRTKATIWHHGRGESQEGCRNACVARRPSGRYTRRGRGPSRWSRRPWF